MKQYCYNRIYLIKKILYELFESVKIRMIIFFFLKIEINKGKYNDFNELSCGKSEC